MPALGFGETNMFPPGAFHASRSHLRFHSVEYPSSIYMQTCICEPACNFMCLRLSCICGYAHKSLLLLNAVSLLAFLVIDLSISHQHWEYSEKNNGVLSLLLFLTSYNIILMFMACAVLVSFCFLPAFSVFPYSQIISFFQR